MKEKEKWAREFCGAQGIWRDLDEYGEACWLAGFEFALKKCNEALFDWEGRGHNAFDLIGSNEVETGHPVGGKK